MHILVPSIVDPAIAQGGAWTVTRGLLAMLRDGPWRARIACVPVGRDGPWRHRLRQAGSVVRTLVSPLPAKAAFVRRRAMLRAVQARLEERSWDLVLLNGADLLWLLPALPASMPKALVAHNLEHALYAAQVATLAERWPAAARLLARDQARLARYELDGLRDVANVVFLSRADEADACAACPGLRTLVVPPVFDAPVRPRDAPARDPDRLHVGLMANFDWWPNRQGLQWFLDRVFPALGSRATLHLFGRGAKRAAAAGPGVVAHGFVASPAQAFDACDLMIAPIQSGSGVCVKVAEAVYHRMPVLTTSTGARGLPLGEDPGIVVRDRPADWIDFLASAGAVRLRTHRIAERCTGPFHASAHAGALHAFLDTLLAVRGAGAAR